MRSTFLNAGAAAALFGLSLLCGAARADTITFDNPGDPAAQSYASGDAFSTNSNAYSFSVNADSAIVDTAADLEANATLGCFVGVCSDSSGTQALYVFGSSNAGSVTLTLADPFDNITNPTGMLFDLTSFDAAIATVSDFFGDLFNTAITITGTVDPNLCVSDGLPTCSPTASYEFDAGNPGDDGSFVTEILNDPNNVFNDLSSVTFSLAQPTDSNQSASNDFALDNIVLTTFTPGQQACSGPACGPPPNPNAVPEPSTALLLAAGLGALAWLRRRPARI
jgi:hypothetical protein